MDNSKLDEFMKKYWNAGSSNNFDLVAPYLHGDASFFFSEDSFFGLEQIGKAFESTWSTIIYEAYNTENIRWVVNNEKVAVCTYDFSSEGYIDKIHRTLRGIGTNVLEKTDGQWKIVHEHLSLIKRE